MIRSLTYLICLSGVVFTSCQSNSNKQKSAEESLSIVQQVEETSNELNQLIKPLKLIATLDHHAMAKEEGVYTPPSIASIFSDSKVNTALLQNNQLIGLDLPFKFLCYSEVDTAKVSIAYTSGDFIAKRHGLSKELLADYNSQVERVVGSLNNISVSETNIDSVSTGYGIISIQSEFDFLTTIQNLKNIVMSQSDTKWFGEVDFQNEAKMLEVDIDPTILLLFGGPAPGGKAMETTPKIGLDAFCQKLLVYEDQNGKVWVAFNDIVAFSKLYYGLATKPQNMINQRLTATFSNAVKK